MFVALSLLLTGPESWPSALGDPPAATRESWEQNQRERWRALFQQEMYGRLPARPAAVSGRVVYENSTALNGKATVREMAIELAPGTPPVYWLVVTPNRRAKPVPAFVLLNFSGNHTVLDDPKVRQTTAWLAAKRKDAKRGSASANWPLERIVDAGFAVATAYYGEVVPDDPKESSPLAEFLRPRPAAGDTADTGAVMAWGWGLARGADYLATLPEIDAQKLIALGHSRLGKAALVGAAFDPVFAAVIANQAGCGGSGPSRTDNPKAETVERINKSFPHWFCAKFKTYNNSPERLPFDQHALVALCAPRPVLFTAATDDQWANPPGQVRVLQAAALVYALYGHPAAAPADYPPENTRAGTRLAFWVRPGKHAMTATDWQQYLDWAKATVR